MQPHGCRIVNPETQLGSLKSGHYIRIIVGVEAGAALGALLQQGQVSLNGQMQAKIRFAIKFGGWPQGEALTTVRIQPTERFDVAQFVATIWPHVSEGFTIPSNPHFTAKTRAIKSGATNRDRRTGH